MITCQQNQLYLSLPKQYIVSVYYSNHKAYGNNNREEEEEDQIVLNPQPQKLKGDTGSGAHHIAYIIYSSLYFIRRQ